MTTLTAKEAFEQKATKVLTFLMIGMILLAYPLLIVFQQMNVKMSDEINSITEVAQQLERAVR